MEVKDPVVAHRKEALDREARPRAGHERLHEAAPASKRMHAVASEDSVRAVRTLATVEAPPSYLRPWVKVGR